MAGGETADYIVERCEQCGLLNVVSRSRGDGSRCADCAGAMTPLGYAVLQGRAVSRMSLELFVERSQLDRLMRNIETVHDEVNDIAEKMKEIREAVKAYTPRSK